MRNQTLTVALLLAALTLLPTLPAAAVLDGAQPLAADVPSKVWLDLYETGELDSLRVRAGDQSSDLHGETGTWSCVSAERSSVRTEFRRGHEYEITTEQREHGCAEDIQYRFDQTAWRTSVTVPIPTTLHTTVGERGPYGWQLIEETEEPTTAIVRLRWTGVGDQRVDTWVHPPSICYTFPPTPCFYGAGVTSWRPADVTGRIRLEGLSQELHIATTRWAGMRWWAGS